MKQEHDVEGALEALDKIENFVHDKHQSDKDNDDVLYRCSFGKIRAALTAAKYKPVTFQDVQRWASIVVSDIEGGYSSEEVKTANAICYATAGEPPQDGGDDGI